MAGKSASCVFVNNACISSSENIQLNNLPRLRRICIQYCTSNIAPAAGHDVMCECWQQLVIITRDISTLLTTERTGDMNLDCRHEPWACPKGVGGDSEWRKCPNNGATRHDASIRPLCTRLFLSPDDYSIHLVS
jgi:hypothetical protein